mmetsp:Transcript_13533/g.13267  ORF Transcript_13533/g.13267 Transcript_13533/m.13267 type:complete len:136 (+) Transcript_13533:321-728(+)
MMAEAGYDVWFANGRGNKHSLQHRTMNASDSAFWNFTFEEHAMYDLPAIVTYIQEVTLVEKMAFVGYSQGATILFAALSEREDFYKDKLSIAICLGPATSLHLTKSTSAKILASWGKIWYWVYNGLNVETLFFPD